MGESSKESAVPASLFSHHYIFMPIMLSLRSEAYISMSEVSSQQADDSIFISKAPSHC